MNSKPTHKNQQDAPCDFRQIDDTYIFDSASGIYKPKTHANQTQPSQHAKRITWKPPIRIKILRDWLAIVISIATLGLIAIYTHYARLQWCEMQKAANAAKDAADTAAESMHLDQRAWISVAGKGNVTIQETKNIVLPVRLSNSGKTPALHVAGKIGVLLLDKGEEPPLDFPEGWHGVDFSIGTLWQNGHSDFVLPVLASNIGGKPRLIVADKGIRMTIRSGDKSIVLFSRTEFRDVFGVPHWVKECTYIGGIGNVTSAFMQGENTAGSGKRCTDYNDIDKNK